MKLSINGYREINYIVLPPYVKYSQGNTMTIVKLNNRHNNTKFVNYEAAGTVDRINMQAYRHGRRHYEILAFIEAAFSLATRHTYVFTKILASDGSTRATICNAIAFLLILNGYKQYPLANSFGLYNNEIIYDLDYKQDSQGTADCAIAYAKLIDKSPIITSIIYEGHMTINQFITGLQQSEKNVLNLESALLETTKNENN